MEREVPVSKLDADIKQIVIDAVSHLPFGKVLIGSDGSLYGSTLINAERMSVPIGFEYNYHPGRKGLNSSLISYFNGGTIPYNCWALGQEYFRNTYIKSPLHPLRLHRKILDDDYLRHYYLGSSMPHTCLGYQTLLNCALYRHFWLGHTVKDLYLNLAMVNYKPHGSEGSIYNFVFTPEQYSLLFDFNGVVLFLNNDARGVPVEQFEMNFGDVIKKIKVPTYFPYPFLYHERFVAVFDELMKVKSWSVGLKYLSDMLWYLKRDERHVIEPLDATDINRIKC